MEKFNVDVTVKCTKTFTVEAESADEAVDIANGIQVNESLDSGDWKHDTEFEAHAQTRKQRRVRVTFRMEAYITADTLADCKRTFVGTPIEALHPEFVELETVEDVDNGNADITGDWNECTEV